MPYPSRLSLTLILIALVPTFARAVEVEFGDTTIEAKIRFLLEIPPEDSIEDTDLLALITLSIRGFGITDLSGLEFLLNLVELDLASNLIENLSPLSALTSLENLDLADNEIANLTALTLLTNLDELNLADNEIESLNGLAGLTNLRDLDLSENEIISIAELSGLTRLTNVDLHDNRIGDVFPLLNNGGLGFPDIVNLLDNPLARDSICDAIPTLEGRNVVVLFEGQCPGAVEGQVIDLTTGLVVDCALIVATAPGIGAGIAFTDLDGRYRADDLPPGAYTLEVFAPNYERNFLPGTVEEGGVNTVNFFLTPLVRDDIELLTGTVDDALTNLDLVGVEVVALQGSDIIDTTFTCPAGAYELLIPAGKGDGITVEFSAPGYSGQDFELPAGETGPLNVSLAPRETDLPGSLSGTVSAIETSMGFSGARVIVKRTGGRVAVATTTDSLGRYSVPNLEPGQYAVQFSSPAHTNAGVNRNVTIGGAESTLDLTIGTLPFLFSCAATGASNTQRAIPTGDLMSLLMMFTLVILWGRYPSPSPCNQRFGTRFTRRFGL